MKITNTVRTPILSAVLAILVGCGSGTTQETTPPVTAAEPAADKQPATTNDALPVEAKVAETTTKPERKFKPIVIDSYGSEPAATDTTAGKKIESVQDVINQLKPIQVILGRWRGTTRKDYEGFKAVDNHEWIWDLQTDPKKPALVMQSDKSRYLRSARVTAGEMAGQFVMSVIDPAGAQRTLTGEFVEPVADVAIDNKLQRTFKLQFVEQSEQKEQWRFTFAQQQNDRYILEVDRRRGKAAFRRYDTVSTLREGTSFALSDSDYGEKTCIISQGLGTISVSHNGKSYWVCCSGCKAAFEDDPAKWIAAAAKRKTEN